MNATLLDHRLFLSRVSRYWLALGFLVVAFGIRIAIAPLIQGPFPYAIVPLAVLVAAWYCGVGPAVMNTVLGYIGLELLSDAPFQAATSTIALGVAVNGTIIYFVAKFRNEHDRLRQAEAKLMQSEAKLSQSERRIRSIFDSVALGITEADLQGRFVAVNEQMCRMTGYSREKLLGMGIVDITAPEDRDYARRVSGMLREGKLDRASYDKRYLRRDGSRIWGHVTASPVRDKSGRLLHFVGTIEDISERKRAEEALKASEDRYRDLVQSSQDLICTYELDGRLLSVNPSAGQLLGYLPEEMIGKNIREFLAAEVLDEFDQHLVRVRSEGFASGFMRVKTRAGENRVWEYSSTLRKEATPAPIVRGMAHDATERLKAEKELRKSEELLRLALAAGRAFAWSWNINKNALHCSDEYYRLFGFPPDSDKPSAEAVLARIHAEDRRRMEARFRNAIEHGADVEGVFRVMLPDGSVRWIRCISRAQYDSQQRPARLTGIAIDVTQYMQATEELRRANERLREADRQKDDFLALLSHELRNPLMPIKHGLYVINHTPLGGELARRALSTIERQVDQITRLVNDLLDVSRVSRGMVRLQRERLDLRQVIGRTLEDFRPLFASRGIHVDQRHPEQPVWINADSSRIAQVLGNLLHNAAKFTPEGGTISITLAQQAEQAVLRVEDNGAGIPGHLLQRIFEPFTQAEQNLARSAGGLGLGLALVKGLVDLHGGSVEAHSEGAGKGAHFTIRLPVDNAPVAESGVPSTRVQPHACRVLLIDDNIDNAQTLADVLELDGHEVAVSYSGLDGLGKARSFRPDVVFCDIGLPGMDGYEVARAFRNDSELKDTALVALTGYGSADDRERAAAAGFDRHVVKPPSHEELERVLSGLPERRTD